MSRRRGPQAHRTFRFCIDNGIMIAQAGLLSFRMGCETSLLKSTCTQRYVKLFADIEAYLTNHQFPNRQGSCCLASLACLRAVS